MAYSKAKARQEARSKTFPDLFYSPDGKEHKLFHSAEEVPFGWRTRVAISVNPSMDTNPIVGVQLDRSDLLAKLMELNVEIDHSWGNAHMKRIIDGDISPTR